MAHTHNTDKAQRQRRTGEWDELFDGRRYGNKRHQEAELKVRHRRIDRARNKREMHAMMVFA